MTPIGAAVIFRAADRQTVRRVRSLRQRRGHMESLLSRFLRYIAFDTPSRAGARQSRNGQRRLAQTLSEELQQLGLTQVALNAQGGLTAILPASVPWRAPAIGFVAHLDTAPYCAGKGIRPCITQRYHGGDLLLGESGTVLSPARYPFLRALTDQTLITANGNTLLGAASKAGIAALMTAVACLRHKGLPHGEIQLAFLPDKEIGLATGALDKTIFQPAWACTLDGEGVGAIYPETFNAAEAVITFVGRAAPPGAAQGRLVNALTLAMRFQQCLPAQESAEQSRDRAGFYHLCDIKGDAARAELRYLLRDFSREGFEARKSALITVARQVGQGLHPECYIEVMIEDRHYNMLPVLERHPQVLTLAQQAVRDSGLTPQLRPMRHETVAARLADGGLPCFGLFTGGYNYHTREEIVSLTGMEKTVQVILNLAQLTAEQARYTPGVANNAHM